MLGGMKPVKDTEEDRDGGDACSHIVLSEHSNLHKKLSFRLFCAELL